VDERNLLDGRKAIRVSVSNWQTGDDETDLAVEMFRSTASGAVTHAGGACL